MGERDQFLQAFVVEAKEALVRLDSDLVALESEPANAALLDSVFRNLHSLKGSAGFLQFDDLRNFAHDGENLLAEVRSGAAPFTPEIASQLLAVIDNIRQRVEALDAGTDKDDERDSTATIAVGRAAPRVPPPPSPSAIIPPPLPAASESRYHVPPAPPRPLSQSKIIPIDSLPPAPISTPTPTPEPTRASAAVSRSTGFRVEGIRVDVQLLDRLMNLVGELVLARNQVTQSNAVKNNAEFHGFAQRLSLITSALQEGIMKTRLQPISAVWQRLPRMVRDLARQCGKEVSLRIEGETTELDKSLLEALVEPMLHLVRNAIDHGIEKTAIRRSRNKPERGLLHLVAYHQGGQVHIEIRDDGAGLDIEKIRQIAVQKGLMTREESVQLSDREIQSAIFLPGFTTAEQVTDISGRGVGMDVVKTKIEEIGGLVDLTSRAGEGTTVHIKVPLTLAIVPALIVECGGECYAIPQNNLVELMTLSAEAAANEIEYVFHAPVFRLRGKLLPLVDLRAVFRLDTEPRHGGAPIAILQVDERRFGLIVDRIVNVEEIVVKPLCSALKGLAVYSGATILGDGRVALILDLLGLARQAGVLSRTARRASFGDSLPPQVRIAKDSVLVCDVGADRRVGIPLVHVVLIERFPRSSIEFSYDHSVVQYRDELMTLISLNDQLDHTPLPAPPDPVPVVVCRQGDRVFGVSADRIVDFVEVPSDVNVSDRDEILSGAAVILNRVTDILNIPGLVRKTKALFFETSTRSRLL